MPVIERVALLNIPRPDFLGLLIYQFYRKKQSRYSMWGIWQ
ncbi:MAG: hypothetical protein JWP12_3949 [Bacteroidetes bacterium]|nr:hypothetical protein [Bacteroidota bacterium]